MAKISATPLPEIAFLQSYARRGDCYTDCFSLRVTGAVNLHRFVRVFYTTPLFRLERFILKISVRKPSKDADIDAIFAHSTGFAAWTVEQQSDDQLLMCDMAGRTRSWFMVRPDGDGTRLFFGSAVTPAKPGGPLGPVFTALLGFHKLYSYALLWSAQRRL